jgi:hypothetical protein
MDFAQVRVAVSGYDGRDLPQNFQEAETVYIPQPEIEVDRAELADEIDRLLGEAGHNYVLRDTQVRINWGASGSSLDFVIALLGGIPGAVALLQPVIRRLRRRREAAPRISAEVAVGIVRRELSMFLNIAPVRIEIDEVDRGPDGHVLSCQVPDGRRFEARVDPSGTLLRLKRTDADAVDLGSDGPHGGPNSR